MKRHHPDEQPDPMELHGKPLTAELALADAWASIDGRLKEFRAGMGMSFDDECNHAGGHFTGYICDAESMIERLRQRGFAIVPSAR